MRIHSNPFCWNKIDIMCVKIKIGNISMTLYIIPRQKLYIIPKQIFETTQMTGNLFLFLSFFMLAMNVLPICQAGADFSLLQQMFPNAEVQILIDSTYNATIQQPTGLLILQQGVFIMVNSKMHVIQVVDVESGFVAIVAGSYGVAGYRNALEGKDALFQIPFAIAAPPVRPFEYFVVTESVNGCLRKISTSSPFEVSTMICSASNNPLGDPKDVTILLNGDMFIANGIYNNILFYSPSLNILKVYAGSETYKAGFVNGRGLDQALFNQPLSIVYFNGLLYVSDFLNNAIRTITTTYEDPTAVPRIVSTLVGFAGTPGLLDGAFSVALLHGPKNIRLMNQRYLAVADSENGAIRLLDSVSETTFTIFGDGTQAVVTGSFLQAKASSIWSLDGSFYAKTLIFAEMDTNMVRIVCLVSC